MSEYDLHSNVKNLTSHAPIDITTTSPVGAVIDTKGFESIEFIIQSGTLNAGTFVPLLEESDDASFSVGVTTVTTEQTLGDTTIGFDGSDVLHDNETIRIGSIGKKRYQRLTIVAAGSSGANFFSAAVVLGNPHSSPQVQLALPVT